MTTLVVIESGGKIDKIKKILGKDYNIVASLGHIVDLNARSMSIDIENNFTPQYINKPDKGQIIQKLKQAGAKANRVLLGGDIDDEGEFICFSVAKILNIKNPIRIRFTEITKQAIQNAVNNPGTLDQDLLNRQKARRVLDRLIGYHLSPLLDKHFGIPQLSAGRVVSVVERLIIDKENEVQEFLSSDIKSHYKLYGDFDWKDQKFHTTLHTITQQKTKTKKETEGLKGIITQTPDKNEIKNLLNKSIDSNFTLAHIISGESTKSPPSAFTTSTMTQDANRKFGFTSKRTMASAQKLYESGYITYMRTDSSTLSQEATENIKKYVLETYGQNYYQHRVHKSKGGKGAHECIRPTDVFTTDVDEGGKIGSDEKRLYSLIWRRAVASLMSPAIYNNQTLQIVPDKLDNHFYSTTVKNLKFNGFLVVYNIKNIDQDENEEEDDIVLDIPPKGSAIIFDQFQCVQTYDRQPPRFNEASLIEKLEPANLNIGRPATYASIITKLIEKNYAEIKDIDGKQVNCTNITWSRKTGQTVESSKKTNIGQEKKKFVPTQLGISITKFLVEHFSQILDYKFTSTLEEKLDQIASGKLIWYNVVKEVYDQFKPLVLQLTQLPTGPNAKLLGTDPKTGHQVYVTLAKFGYVVKSIPSNTKEKPKYAPIPQALTHETITLEDALPLLSYPKEIGDHNGDPIILNKGKFGFYITCNGINLNVENENVDLEDVITKLQEKQANSLATFKDKNMLYTIIKGQYGPYINIYNIKTKKKANVKLPKDLEPTKLTLEKINEVVNAKRQGKQTNSRKGKTTKTKETTPKPKTTRTKKTTKAETSEENVGSIDFVDSEEDEEPEVEPTEPIKPVQPARVTRSVTRKMAQAKTTNDVPAKSTVKTTKPEPDKTEAKPKRKYVRKTVATSTRVTRSMAQKKKE